VPPCVVRTVPEVDPDAPGALSAERFDEREADVFFHTPQLAMRGAFFDALIANQDRSRGNLLFEAARDDLALIDHGFCFPRDGDIHHNALLVDWRRRSGMCELDDDEAAALRRLLEDEDLLGLRR
jgi:streptomycin 6-kinase